MLRYIYDDFLDNIRAMTGHDEVTSKLETFGFSFWICNSVISFIICLCLTFKIQPALFQKSDSRVGKWYRSERTANQINGTSMTSSSIHAIVATICAAYIVFLDPKAGPNVPESNSNVIKWTQSMSLGYFFADYIVLIHTRELGGTGPIIFHHSAAISAYLVSMHYNKLGWYSAFRLMSELSTPFVNFRWQLYALGLKNTKRYKINGLLMTGSFFLCRIASFPFYWYYVYQSLGTEAFSDIPPVLTFFWLLVPAMLDVLNCFWFYKMMKGLIKALQKPDAPEDGEIQRKRKRDMVKQYVQNKYINFKSVIMRRKNRPWVDDTKRNE